MKTNKKCIQYFIFTKAVTLRRLIQCTEECLYDACFVDVAPTASRATDSGTITQSSVSSLSLPLPSFMVPVELLFSTRMCLRPTPLTALLNNCFALILLLGFCHAEAPHLFARAVSNFLSDALCWTAIQNNLVTTSSSGTVLLKKLLHQNFYSLNKNNLLLLHDALSHFGSELKSLVKRPVIAFISDHFTAIIVSNIKTRKDD